MQEICLAVDNYFALPKIMLLLREKGIGVVGTSRFQKNWPSKKLKNIDNADFNHLYCFVDEHGTLVTCWMDNGFVYCVTTLHRIWGIVKRLRKRPHVTQKNRGHVSKIWGDESRMEMLNPTLIGDCNHWIGGVDVADQQIAYFHLNLRCFRIWILMFIQIISIIRNNSYIVHQNQFKDKALKH